MTEVRGFDYHFFHDRPWPPIPVHAVGPERLHHHKNKSINWHKAWTINLSGRPRTEPSFGDRGHLTALQVPGREFSSFQTRSAQIHVNHLLDGRRLPPTPGASSAEVFFVRQDG